MELVYHKSGNNESPFDRKIVEIARNSRVSIACPYLTLEYLERIIRISRSWRLVTDICEWIGSTSISKRNELSKFITNNDSCIRHLSGLHSKVVLGEHSALVSSSNLTSSGIRVRTEMGVWFTDSDKIDELTEWFQAIWDNANQTTPSQISSMQVELPESTPITKPMELTVNARRPSQLITLIEDLDIRSYNGARGYYTGYDREFCVIAGSNAKRSVSNAFLRTSNGGYNELRQRLIDSGVLHRENDWSDYTFTRDYTFNTPSPAACIVDGQSRSGPDCWGRP